MKNGVPGFCGARLREAREVRNLTILALSDLVSVSRQSLHAYEAGEQAPMLDVSSRISTALNLPPRFFTLPPRQLELSNFRSRATATQGEKKRVGWRYRWHADIVDYLGQWVHFPFTNLWNKEPLRDDFDSLSENDVEKLAGEVRYQWELGDGPIDNLTWLLEGNGIFVGRDDSDVDHVFAMSRWVGSQPQMLLQTANSSAVKDRFSAAHELFHLLAGHDPEVDDVSLTVQKHREKLANRFAAAFLFPARQFNEALGLPSLEAFAGLKSRWGISIGAQIKRARHLDLISEKQEKSLWVSYSRRGFRTHEPLDDRIAPETPTLLPQSFDAVLEAGLTTKRMIVDDLARPAADIEKLSGLPAGYLAPTAPSPHLRIVPGGRRP